MEQIALWKAMTCFGDSQVTKVIKEPAWRDQFADVYLGLDSKDDRLRFDTLIPVAMLRAMAKGTPSQYAFGTKDDVLKCRQQVEDLPRGFKPLSSLEALERFGGEQMFQAVEYGTSQAGPN